MSVVLTIAGQTFNYPSTGDDGWGEQATSWAQAVSTQLLQRTGGTFTLTNDVNFGASFATIQAYLKSRSTNIANTGFIRMAKGDSVVWRNNNNDGNVVLAINGSDQVTINGTPVLVGAGGVLAVAEGGTGLSSYTIGDLIYASGTTTLSKLGIGTSAFVLRSSGSAPSWGLLLNANIDAAAAIDRTKLATGSANHVVINSNTGAFSSEAQLAGTRGGTGVSSTATFPTSGVVVTEAATETLSNKIYLNAVVAKVFSDSPYTISATDYLVLNDCTSGAIVNTLPAASTNIGRIFKIKKTDSTLNAVTISRAGSDTIIDVASGLTSVTLNTQGEELEIFCATSTTWQVISRRIPSLWTAFTPTGSWSANTTYTGFWKRVGDAVAIQVQVATTGAPTSAPLTVNNPTGITTDTAKLVATTSGFTLGSSTAFDSGTTRYPGVVVYSSSSAVALYYIQGAASAPCTQNTIQQNDPFAFGSGDVVNMAYEIPVSGWSA